MNIKEENICRLCLKVAESDFQIIDENAMKIFEVLLLRVNLDVSKDPIICKDCSEVTEKCFNFKSAFIDTKIPMITLEDVYKDGKHIESVVENSICRFCSNRLSGSNFVLLDTLMNDVMVAEMLQPLMPEMDFDVIKNPVICTTCKQDLECYIKFVKNCLEVEKKIIKYYQNKGTPPYVKLSEIVPFLFTNNMELDNFKMCAIKQENLVEDLGEAHSDTYDSKLIKAEELDIKDEETTSSDMPLDKLNIPCGSSSQIRESSSFTQIQKVFKCAICTCQTKYKGSLKRHLLIHSRRDNKEVEVHKCSMCTFQTKRKPNLKIHMSIHNKIPKLETYKCSMCSYQTKEKANLKTHMLIHKDMTEVDLYVCSICTYQAKYKGNLKRHLLIHKDVTKVEMYKCSMCTYETKYKNSLTRHMFIHKDITEVELYKCSMCTYETKHKDYLKRHVLIHKEITEMELYKCSMCTYKTRRKRNLSKHMVIHKDITEVELYKCALCTFKTKHKSSLKCHMIIHKNITERTESALGNYCVL